MKVLLVAVNAKYIHSNPAVYCLRAYAAEFQEYIEIAEYTVNNRAEAILADLFRRRPQVIAFSCYIWNWKVIQELLPEIPKVMPGIHIWLGGPEVSFDAPEILACFPQLTGIMLGEGEETFRELMEYYCNSSKELTSMSGICLPGSGATGTRALGNLDSFPFPYENMEEFRNRILYYESSRGCPFRCSYCLSSIDKSVRLRSLDLVKQELLVFLEQKVPQVKFVDRTFNCNHAHALGIWRFLKEHDNGVTNFHFEIAADLLNEEELSLLETLRPGMVQLEIGVQSTNLQTLREIHRTADFERLKEAVLRIRNGKNIHIHLDLIAGLPMEDYDSFVTSFNMVYFLGPDQLQLGFLKVLKGSCMYEKAEVYGISYHSAAPYEVLYSKWLSYEEVLKLKRVEEMLEVYYNSRQFTNTLRVLEQAFPHPFRLYEELASYYEAQGFAVNSPARSRRYEILLEFAVLKDGQREALYRELLTFDLYLREKCKSRPAFATDRAPFRDALRSREGDKKEHVEIFFYPVWESGRETAEKRRREPYFVRFCYEKRDPLSHNAEITIL